MNIELLEIARDALTSMASTTISFSFHQYIETNEINTMLVDIKSMLEACIGRQVDFPTHMYSNQFKNIVHIIITIMNDEIRSKSSSPIELTYPWDSHTSNDNSCTSKEEQTCLGCKEDQPNQTAHMDQGGCMDREECMDRTDQEECMDRMDQEPCTSNLNFVT